MTKKERLKKSIKDLPNNWEKLLIKQAPNGASESELRVVLGCISDDLWYRLIAGNKDLSQAVSQSKLFSQSWWERKGQENIDNNKFNTRLWNKASIERKQIHQRMIFPEELAFNTSTLVFGTEKISPLYRYAPLKKTFL